MDIRIYFQKVKAVEDSIDGMHAVIRSLETPDGGKAGVLTEVGRNLAARLVVDGRAVLASADEAKQFYRDAADAKAAFERIQAAKMVQVTVISEADLHKPQQRKG
ncbi:MAG TPA: hypothetical protein VMZ52_03485 [Bryobacteraceae bacterium]|nr:hypothetical protein [Bryobacteraceae bacterium]